MTISHRTVTLDGTTIFYREAGDPTAPTLLLLHGFPTSSHMFRNLMPALADRLIWSRPTCPASAFPRHRTAPASPTASTIWPR